MAPASRRISLLPLAAVPLLLLAVLTGCSGFFVYPGTSSSSSSGSGDYAYASNSASGSNYINGYSLSGGSLVATTGSPYSLGFIPSAMVVTTNNSYLYIASSGSAGEIYGYSIGSGGALTLLNSSLGLEAENSVALDVSPDGQWLFSLNADGLTLEEYKINTSTGILTAEGNYPITGIAGGVVTPTSLRIAPSGNYIAAALGTGGADIFAFTTSTGIASSSAAVLAPLSTANGFYSADIDSSNNLYLSGTSGLVVYTVVAGSGSATATLASSTTGYTLGSGNLSTTINTANKYVFAGSENSSTSSGTIYSYAIGTGGALNILNGGVGLEAENSAALAVSPDGQWLFSLNSDGITMEEYQINTTTGVLTSEGNYPITATAGGIVTPTALKVAPSGAYIACSLGTAGVDVFSFATSTGVASSSAAVLPPPSASSGFYSLAIDSSNNLFLAGTSGLVDYTVVSNSNGSVTATLASSSTGYTLGTGNDSISISKSGSYVYAGSQNGGSGSTIYGYAVGTGAALTAVTGSPFNAPTDVAALGYDSTGDYLIGIGYSATSGTQLFTIGSAGALTSSSSAASGTTLTIPAIVALTH